MLDFLKLLFDKEGNYTLDRTDEIIAASLVCADGEVLRKSPAAPVPASETPSANTVAK
ncbi:hypothetical protein D3C72_2398750 [compost metagenome]